MKKIKYEDAVMEIVRFDFEDVLDESTQDNIGNGSGFDYTGDDAGGGSPWDSQ